MCHASIVYILRATYLTKDIYIYTQYSYYINIYNYCQNNEYVVSTCGIIQLDFSKVKNINPYIGIFHSIMCKLILPIIIP